MEEKEKNVGMAKVLIWSFAQMWQLSKRDTFLIVVSNVLLSFLPTLSVYLETRIYNGIVQIFSSELSHQSDLIAVMGNEFLIVILFFTFFRILHSCLTILADYVKQRFNSIHIREFDIKIVKKISSLSPQQFELPDVNNTIIKATDNSWRLVDFSLYFITFVSTLLSFITVFTISLSFSPVLTIVFFLLNIPNVLLNYKSVKLWWNMYRDNIEQLRFITWVKNSTIVAHKILENTISGAKSFLLNTYMSRNREIGAMDFKTYIPKFIGNIYSGTLGGVSGAILIIALVYFVLLGRVTTIGDFVFYRDRMSNSIVLTGNLVYMWSMLVDKAFSMRQIIELLNLKPEIISGKKKLKNAKIAPKIEFRNVWFKYPNSDQYVFKGLNLTLESGKEVAIIGENGAGKTTLIKLLLRIYDPQKGEIVVNGVNLKELDLDLYYGMIGSLGQDFNKYGEFDVKTNIFLGRSNKKIDIERVYDSAKFADVDNYIERLPQKYNQKLDPKFTGGTTPSGGQWQKIAIARVFYRDAPVLILDEPTASIDAMSEYKIFNRIYNSLKNKTVIIISHRFSTVRNAQKIYILHKGKIVEQGSHAELMKLSGRYAKAFNLQAGGYQEKE